MDLKHGYCPICNKFFRFFTDDVFRACPDCGHHVMLHEQEVDDDQNFIFSI